MVEPSSLSPSDESIIRECERDVTWGWIVRLAHAGFAFFGMTLTALVAIFAFICILESPYTPRRTLVIWAVCTTVEAAHLLIITRRSRRKLPSTWLLFFIAVAAMVWNTWSVLRDPDSRFLFSVVASIAAIWLAGMGAISFGLGPVLGRRPVAAVLVALFAWLPFFGLFSLFALWYWSRLHRGIF